MKKPLLILWIFISWILYPLFSLIAKKRNSELVYKKRILVIPQLTRIGDIVCSTPVFYNIKNKYPDSYLSVLISKKAIGIIKNNTRIDEIIVIEEYSFFKLINKIRNCNFNYSINLSATSVNTCLTLWSLIDNRIKTIVEKPPITERLTDWMSNHKLLYKNHTYLPLHHTKLLRFMDIIDPVDKKEVFTSEIAENKSRVWRESFPKYIKIVGLSITAGNKIKELGDDKFEVLIRQLLEIENIMVCCIGSKSDKGRIEALIKKVNNRNLVQATDFNLEELPSLIKEFSLYIAVDTGPIYIAHAMGVPLIDIIGPVDPNEQPPQDAISIRILPRGNIAPSSFVFKKRGTIYEIKKALESTYVEDIFNEAKNLVS